MVLYKILLVVSILVSVIAQFSLKYGMKKANIQSFTQEHPIEIFRRMFINFFVAMGFFFYGISLLLWLVILSGLDLSYAYPMVSLSYFFVAFGSRVIFKERVSMGRWLSIFVIVFGVVLVSIS